MDRFDFYNIAKPGTIRERVADFMDNDSYLSKLKGDKWYRMEDALCDFIEQNDELIFRFKDREYMTNDIVCNLESKGYKIPDASILEEMEEFYEDDLGESDLAADARSAAFDNTVFEFASQLTQEE